MVSRIVKNGPAAKAGIRQGDKELAVGNRVFLLGGDIITAVDGKPIKTIDSFINYVESKRPGQSVSLNLIRENKPMTVSVQLEERPNQ